MNGQTEWQSGEVAKCVSAKWLCHFVTLPLRHSWKAKAPEPAARGFAFPSPYTLLIAYSEGFLFNFLKIFFAVFSST
jgi:hypothetical protein